MIYMCLSPLHGVGSHSLIHYVHTWTYYMKRNYEQEKKSHATTFVRCFHRDSQIVSQRDYHIDQTHLPHSVSVTKHTFVPRMFIGLLCKETASPTFVSSHPTSTLTPVIWVHACLLAFMHKIKQNSTEPN